MWWRRGTRRAQESGKCFPRCPSQKERLEENGTMEGGEEARPGDRWGGQWNGGRRQESKKRPRGSGGQWQEEARGAREWDRTIHIDVKGRGLAVVIVERIRGVYNRVDPHVTPEPIPKVGRNFLNRNALRHHEKKRPMGRGPLARARRRGWGQGFFFKGCVGGHTRGDGAVEKADLLCGAGAGRSVTDGDHAMMTAERRWPKWCDRVMHSLRFGSRHWGEGGI